MVLYGLALLDEMTSGVPTISAPDIEQGFGLSHAATAAVLFVLPGVIAMVVEPMIFLLADRYPRVYFVRGGLLAMAVSSAACALAPSAIVLSLSMAVLWIAIGSASALAQATLVDEHPEARGQVMARWTVLATLGDLAAPALLGGIAIAGGSWRAGFAGIAVLLAVATLFAMGAPAPPVVASEDVEEELGLWASLRLALTDRVLVAWLFVTAMCDLLDEILVVFATIHVRTHFAASATAQNVMVAAMTVGGLVGLVVLERGLARKSEAWMLRTKATGCALVFVAWVVAPPLLAELGLSPTVACITLAAPVGAFVAPLYPLCAAQAFARRPDASGSVLAAGHLFTPLGWRCRSSSG